MLLQQLVNGLTLGTTYAMLALGYSLIFGVLSFINFAHGDVAVVSAYMLWYLISKCALSLIPAFLIAICTGMLLGVIIERIGYKPIRKSPRLSAVIVSMGFSFILSTGIQIVWGTSPHQMPSIGETQYLKVGGAIINTMQIWIFAIAIVIMILLTLLLNKTKIGLAMRSIALDRDTASLMGINVDRTISWVFALGSALGAISAIMMALYYGALYSTMGSTIGTKGFAAVVLGGAGSIPGAMIGGLLLGLIESIAGTLLTAQLKDAVSALVLILMLVLRPAGILGKDVVKE